MKTVRKLTLEEQEALAERLKRLDPSAASIYEYPLEDSIAHLRGRAEGADHEVEEEDGHPLRYFLGFSSPDETWAMLCGRAGTYTIDAESLEATAFDYTAIS